MLKAPHTSPCRAASVNLYGVVKPDLQEKRKIGQVRGGRYVVPFLPDLPSSSGSYLFPRKSILDYFRGLQFLQGDTLVRIPYRRSCVGGQGDVGELCDAGERCLVGSIGLRQWRFRHFLLQCHDSDGMGMMLACSGWVRGFRYVDEIALRACNLLCPAKPAQPSCPFPDQWPFFIKDARLTHSFCELSDVMLLCC